MREQTHDLQFISSTADYLPEGFDWRIIKAQAWQESRFDRKAISPAGARGIMQLMPGTAQDLGVDDTEDAAQNIDAGVCYFADLYNEWSWPRPEIDRIALALASYNAGLGNILEAQELAGGAVGYADIIHELERVTGRHSRETTEYVRKILWFWIQQVVSYA